ncbi:MAG: Clp protease ClpP [Bacteroidales bacterium]|nr:Clp protease ClpP [Bacteroidales bacterium]
MVKKYYSLVTEEKTADIYIFGDITSWEWLESDVSSYSLAMEIQALDVDVINVHINSYGGEVSEALAIYNVLKRQTASVNTYVDGFACSAATIVFMAGDKRIMSKVGNFLVHPAWAYAAGNADDLRKEADDLDRITEQSVTAYMESVTKSREELVELMKEERFMTPEEVLEWGFATEIEEEEESERPAASVRDMVHKLVHAETDFDLDSLADRISDRVADKIKEEDPEDPDEDPDVENPDEDPDEDPEDPDVEDPEKEPEDEDNQKASEPGCFFDAFNK